MSLMKKIISTLFTCTLLFSAQFSLSEEASNQAETPAKLIADDHRIFVSIPEPVREFMRIEMRSHLATINEIIGYLGSNDLDSAAYIAEKNLGRGSMANADIHPGMYMTPEMRNIGWRMHAAATEFALTAKRGDVQSAYSALQKVTSSCVSCHSSFRTR